MRYAGLAVLIVLEYCSPLMPRDTWESAFIKEDRLVELPGSLALLAASIIMVLALRMLRRDPDAPRLLLWVSALLAVVCFVGFGEEISWGQRIFGFGTPKSLNELNEQNELNFHNLKFFSGWLSVDRMFQVFWFGLGVAIPVAARFSTRARDWLRGLVPILPLAIAVLLVFNQIAADASRALLDDRYASKYPLGYSITEIKEAVVAILLAVGVYVWYRGLREDAEPPAET